MMLPVLLKLGFQRHHDQLIPTPAAGACYV
jgi:hypothetical protein